MRLRLISGCRPIYLLKELKESIQVTHGPIMRTTHEGGTIWMLQNENKAERRERIYSQTNTFL
jgi:hypothetical protein